MSFQEPSANDTRPFSPCVRVIADGHYNTAVATMQENMNGGWISRAGHEAELATLQARIDRLTAVIEDAPHEAGCTQSLWANAIRWTGPMPACDCWKLDALGGAK